LFLVESDCVYSDFHVVPFYWGLFPWWWCQNQGKFNVLIHLGKFIVVHVTLNGFASLNIVNGYFAHGFLYP